MPHIYTHMRTRTRILHVSAVVLATAMWLCAFTVTASPSDTADAIDTASAETADAWNATNNYNCPEDCKCVLARNTHIPLLHAKCSSIHGLQKEGPVQATLPIHSIDLSYLRLPRLSHALESLQDVTSIDLSHNELHEIGHLGRRIKKLNLKHNRLTSSKLAKLPRHVQVLNLQHNDITYLPLEFTKLAHLQTLELSHNEINCSCETLEVRNWLQERHVFMEHAVVCSYPVEVKGKPWLQVRQSDICEKEKRGRRLDDDENELMMGDQPVEGSGDLDEDEEEDELGKAYMPIDEKKNGAKSNEIPTDFVEGSGDLSVMNLPLTFNRESGEGTTLSPGEEEEEDGSGSGGGLLIIPHIGGDRLVPDDFDLPDDSSEKGGDDDYDKKPLEEPASEHTPSPAIFGDGMGIFDGQEKPKPITDRPVEEEAIVPVVHHNVESDNVPDEEVSTDGPDAVLTDNLERAEMAPPEESNALYLLFGVIGLIVVGLILFVSIKRCKHNHDNQYDPENPRQTELLDMDKKNLGKPLQSKPNGNEHAPLIGEKTKSDMAKPINGAATKRPYDTKDVKDGPGQQQPLLNGSGNGTTHGAVQQPNESNNNVDENISKVNAPTTEQVPPPHEYHPITPRYPTPKSPRASKYAQYPQGGESNNNNNNNNNDDSFSPSSPKSGRYSPVYSPETGRVKIKLTETPRPKTPMLVNRSKSNAGDIITTPVVPTAAAVANANANMPAVHTGPSVNGH